ncbi:MAG: hypothetical protein WC479_03125 [Candidatus Izemoplasmatales bacterium]
MKYIIFNNKYPVLFSDEVTHCDVSIEGMKPTSAGHFKIKTFGVSESLGLSSRPEDGKLISMLLIRR